jgi:alkylhydroperoxidase family enzyme
MARTPTLTRDQVPEPLRAAFDAETASSGGVVATGPGSVMINSPEMRRRANHLVNYLRDESTLPKKIQELAMLVTARAMDCQFIWNAHAARGRREWTSRFKPVGRFHRTRQGQTWSQCREAMRLSFGSITQ